jgi:hypothetical protein
VETLSLRTLQRLDNYDASELLSERIESIKNMIRMQNGNGRLYFYRLYESLLLQSEYIELQNSNYGEEE